MLINLDDLSSYLDPFTNILLDEGSSMSLLKPILDALNVPDFDTKLAVDATRFSVLNACAGSEDIFEITDLASSSIAAAGLALSQYTTGASDQNKPIIVDQHLAYLWFGSSICPQNWSLSSPWDDLAGDYQTHDGWIRLHTNAPHHRDAACKVLGNLDRQQMIQKVTQWSAGELEQTIVDHGGAAATMMNEDEWRLHPQGGAVKKEPLVSWQIHDGGDCKPKSRLSNGRPLGGLRVLDLTRIIAGPVATRFLAAFGAQVLRIDPKGWDEGEHIIDMTPGKSCATLDFKDKDDLQTLKNLISQADVLVHGYRADALERLGLGGEELRRLNPSLINVAHNAYGWTGPWRNRRGFDSLVQMSSGIAAAGMSASGSLKPRPMTVQALDHGTGYLIAASVLRGLSNLRDKGQACSARLSLAATAELLKTTKRHRFGAVAKSERFDDVSSDVEPTDLGPILRLKSALHIAGAKAYWAKPASLLHQSPAKF